ncbi:hypothetical protein [Streptomyces jumonjinensis]|uniref:hypothetical protein n=1 Tax=Streptomyces jumonjinensis TaxID=1945 RepID=UPI0037935652
MYVLERGSVQGLMAWLLAGMSGPDPVRKKFSSGAETLQFTAAASTEKVMKRFEVTSGIGLMVWNSTLFAPGLAPSV